MSLENFKDVDMREFLLYIKRQCFSRMECKGCKLHSEDGRCFFDHQSLLYEGEKPNGDLYKSIKLLHPCHWDFAGVRAEGWDGDTIRMGDAEKREDGLHSIIRCRQCKYYHEAHYEAPGDSPYIKHQCKNKYGMPKYTVRPDEDYCSRAEKKEEGEG